MPAYTINRCTNCGILTTGISACHECGGETKIEPVSQGWVNVRRTITQNLIANTLVPTNATESECRAFFLHVAETDYVDNSTICSENESFVVTEVIRAEYLQEIETIDQAKWHSDNS